MTLVAVDIQRFECNGFISRKRPFRLILGQATIIGPHWVGPNDRVFAVQAIDRSVRGRPRFVRTDWPGLTLSILRSSEFLTRFESAAHRNICTNCWFRRHLCLCDAYRLLFCGWERKPRRISVYMHDKELLRTSNSAKLICSVHETASLFVRNVAADEERLKAAMEPQIDDPAMFVLYPHEKARTVSAVSLSDPERPTDCADGRFSRLQFAEYAATHKLSDGVGGKCVRPMHVVIVDETWSKASAQPPFSGPAAVRETQRRHGPERAQFLPKQDPRRRHMHRRGLGLPSPRA